METLALIILIFTLIVIALFFLKSKVIVGMHYLLIVGFVCCVIGVVIGLFFPQVFNSLADNTLVGLGTYGSLVQTDQTLNDITDIPNQIIDSIGGFLGGGNNNPPAIQQDYLVAEIYPGLVSGLAAAYRVLALVLSLIGMVVVTYLSYSTAGAYEATKLQHKVKELEKRLEELESRTSSVQ